MSKQVLDLLLLHDGGLQRQDFLVISSEKAQFKVLLFSWKYMMMESDCQSGVPRSMWN